jgi:hypothetical protein
MIDQAMLLFGIRSRFQLDNAWRIFLQVGGRVAVSELNTRVEKQDPEIIRNGGFGKHFPTCQGAGDTTIVRACKHPRRIKADYSGKHKCHGKRGLVIVNGEGRVCWVCRRLFAGRHADIYCAKKGHMARALRRIQRRRARHECSYVETMVDGGFPSLEKEIPNLICPFRRSRGALSVLST